MRTPIKERRAYYLGHHVALRQFRAQGGPLRSVALDALVALHQRAEDELGACDEATLSIRLTLEEARSSTRSSAESAAAFAELATLCDLNLRASDAAALRARALRAQYLRKSGRVDEGIDLYRKELALREQLFGADAYRTCLQRQNLAVALRTRRTPADLEEASELTQVEMETRLAKWGPDHAFTWVATMNRVSLLLVIAERQVTRKADRTSAALEALDLSTEVGQRRMRRLGSRHTATLRAQRAKARALLALGRHQQAQWILWRIRAAEKLGGTEDPGSTALFLAIALSADPATVGRARELVTEAIPALEGNEDQADFQRRASALLVSLEV